VADEAVEGFEAEGEFAEGEGSFGAEVAGAETAEVFRGGVFRAVDDAEVFGAAAFDGWLDEAAFAFDDEVGWFHDHAFAASGGEGFPPCAAEGFAVRIGEVDDEGGSGDDDAAGETGERLEVPFVRLIGVDLSGGGEEVEGSELEIVDGIDRPAVAAVGIGVGGDHVLACGGACEEVGDIDAAGGGGG